MAMTGALARGAKTLGLTAALALGALLSAPASAAAQYTLTFDSPEPTGANDTPITSPYLWPTTSGIVTITDGYATGFGATSLTKTGLCTNSSTNVCFTTDRVNNAPASVTAARITTHDPGVGEFVFTPGAGMVADFTSVVLGVSADHDVESRLYSLDGLTLIATYTASIERDAPILVNQSNFILNGPHTFAELGGGFRFEWGAPLGVRSDQVFFDNLTFKSEIVPEPGTLLLVGTGLLGLAPLVRRRRRKTRP